MDFKKPKGMRLLKQPKGETRLNLVKVLFVRVTTFAFIICLCATVVILYQALHRIQTNITQSSGTLVQLLNTEVTKSKGLFQFSLDRLDDLSLQSISEIGSAIGICVEVRDIHNQSVVDQCFGSTMTSPTLISWTLNKLIDENVRFESPLLTSNSGVVVGQLITFPNITHESSIVWQHLRIVIAMTFGILILNLLVYWPVRQALKPTEEILETISRLESGDLTARMPAPQLQELRKITVGFDHLTQRLEQTIEAQRQLAKRLITAREEERRHLARELHDEFGQLLTAISADSTFLSSRLKRADPTALPAVNSIKSNVAQVMEAVQSMLSQLRPHGLAEFGLRTSIVHLVESWQSKCPGLNIEFKVHGTINNLYDDLSITVYRIVQESLTNALKHGNPTLITITIERLNNRLNLIVDDNGGSVTQDAIVQGNGVIGMNERATALGGVIDIVSKKSGGVRVTATIDLDLEDNEIYDGKDITSLNR